MRCLLVSSFFPPLVGGAAEVYGQLCRHLAPQVSVLATSRDPATDRELPGWREHDVGVSYRVRRIDRLRPARPGAPGLLAGLFDFLRNDVPVRWRAARALAEEVRRVDPEVLCFGQLWAVDWLAGLASLARGRRLAFFLHGEEVTAPTRGRVYGRLGFPMLRRADMIFAVSEFCRDAVVREAGVDAERIHVVPNGVDTDRFRPGPASPELLDRRGLVGKRVLAAVGRLVRRKGLDTLVAAMPEILEAEPDARLLVVGEGPERARLEALVRELDVARAIRFTGAVRRDELPDHFRLAEIFVLPNRTLSDGDTEGFGLVFLEAGACGLPVVGGRSGGVPEAVEDGVSGRLVRGGEASEVARTVIALLRDPEERRRLGTAGRRRALRYTWARQAERFRDLVEGASALHMRD